MGENFKWVWRWYVWGGVLLFQMDAMCLTLHLIALKQWFFVLFYVTLELSCDVYLLTWLKRFVMKKSHYFFSLFPFSLLLSNCPPFLFCLPCFLPEGGTIFWMSRMLINGCQHPPCQSGRSLCATEGVCIWNRDRHTDRKMLAPCLSLLVASVVSARSILHRSTCEKVWHLSSFFFSI